MEDFKKIIRIRRAVLLAYCGLILVLIVCLNMFIPHTGDIKIGFTLGIALGTEILAGLFINQYACALKSDDKLKQLYIKENDERCKFIKAQIGSLGLDMVLSILALATIISVFFDQIIFYTLLFALLCSALVKGILKVYFNLK